MLARFFTSLNLLTLLIASSLVPGCNLGSAPPPPPNPTPPAKLRVLVVDDPALGTAIQREWLAHTENELEVINLSAEQAARSQHLPADVAIYDPVFLGQFASADLLLPIDETALATGEYDREDVFPLSRTQEVTWGRRAFAAPLGSPQFVLFYRTDLLKQHQLQPPRTWQEYATIVEKFAERPAGIGDETPRWQATAEPLAPGWGGRLLLARAAASALHRDQLSPLWHLENFEPLITSPPWVRALEQLVADNRRGNPDPELLTPAGCYARFLAGECALAITWPYTLPDDFLPRIGREQIGMTLLPGSSEVYHPQAGRWEPLGEEESPHVPLLGMTGRVVSVTRASPQPRLATRFVAWLTGPTISGRIAPLSPATTVFRCSHFQNSGSWQAPQALHDQLATYGELLNSVQSAPRRFQMPRIPGQLEYLASLDAAVVAAVKEERTPQEALQQAAEKWQEITRKRGVASQQRALRRSLGLSD